MGKMLNNDYEDNTILPKLTSGNDKKIVP